MPYETASNVSTQFNSTQLNISLSFRFSRAAAAAAQQQQSKTRKLSFSVRRWLSFWSKREKYNVYNILIPKWKKDFALLSQNHAFSNRNEIWEDGIMNLEKLC